MRRLRLWLARLLCPRGYEVMSRWKTAGVVEGEPGRIVDYRFLGQVQ